MPEPLQPGEKTTGEMGVNRVGLVGAGRMGSAMAARLRAAGLDLTVFNRTRAAAEALARSTGAQQAVTPGEAAASAPVVLVSVSDDRAAEDVYLGPHGIIASVRPGTVVCDTSTLDPTTPRKLGPLLASRGAHLLDSPVSGSVATVERGQLTFLVGGEEEDLKLALPVISRLAAKTLHLGPLGSGAAMKLALNTVVHGLNQAISEGLILAESGGIDRSVAYGAIVNSVLGCPFVQYKQEAYERPGETPVAFAIELVVKDLQLAVDMGESTGVPMLQAKANLQTARRAIRRGFGDRDMSALAQMLREDRQASDEHTRTEAESYSHNEDAVPTNPDASVHRNVTALQAFYAAFAEHDPSISELVAKNATWHVLGHHPFSGDYVGRQNVLHRFATIANETSGTVHFDIHDILADDTHGVALVRESMDRKGRHLEANEVHIFHFDEEGRAEEFWEFTEDQRSYDSFWS